MFFVLSISCYIYKDNSSVVCSIWLSGLLISHCTDLNNIPNPRIYRLRWNFHFYCLSFQHRLCAYYWNPLCAPQAGDTRHLGVPCVPNSLQHAPPTHSTRRKPLFRVAWWLRCCHYPTPNVDAMSCDLYETKGLAAANGKVIWKHWLHIDRKRQTTKSTKTASHTRQKWRKDGS